MSAVASLRTPSRAPAATRWRVSVLTRLDQLHALVPEWEALAARTLEPNVFYEPWMMLPALEQFHAKARLEVYAVRAETPQGRRLAALVPFEVYRPHFFSPAPRRRLLRYYYCCLCTPLLDRELGPRALRRLFASLRRTGGAYEFDFMAADGPVMDALRAAAGGAPLALETVERALLRPSGSAEAYLNQVLSPKKRHELRRLERRLREQGELSFERLSPRGDPDPWIADFLALEVSGWKGRGGSALACSERSKAFFRRICLEAHLRRRLDMYALRLNGRPLAMLCLFQSGRAFYAFRTAYDESYAKLSPGLQLCVWHSCEMHNRRDVEWLDSCADPASSLDNMIWPDRRRIGSARLLLGKPSLLQPIMRIASLWS